jgi:hypothetical protein
MLPALLGFVLLICLTPEHSSALERVKVFPVKETGGSCKLHYTIVILISF